MTTTRVLFLTLFLDLVGFSIIFPLFPALLDHYLAVEGDESLLAEIVGALERWVGGEGAVRWRVVTLFGGVLGSIYSLLQFLCSPLWGRLSDRIGRRPVLLVTVGGMAFSYGLWALSGSFLLFVVSRVLGGIMSGNIATVSAAMADITSRRERARGMGIIGAAFGLGFTVGPALGGALSQIRLDQLFPAFAGFHPFSAAAAAACLLSLLNLVWVRQRMRETLAATPAGAVLARSPRPPLGNAIRTTNFAYLLFIAAFSGMEFTLTFLVRERLAWGPGRTAIMFVYIGILIAVVQGGIVRRLTPRWGEKAIAVAGLGLIVPGLLILATAKDAIPVYLGLTSMAVGSAMAIPTLTALVSLYAPEDRQGEALGVFRAAGALGRVVGPCAAGVIFWRFGSATPYWIGAGIILIPMLFAAALPTPVRTRTEDTIVSAS